jgi:hypothetical protein
MEYAKIVAVSGLPGLFELINSKSDGAIVRSLDDKSTRFISNRIHNFSHLESIEVYTVRDNVNLVEIFHAMEGKDKLPDEKDAAAVKKYFEKVYPDMDFERVYNSDLKKMVRWFEVLQKNKIEIKLTEVPEEEEEEMDVVEETKPKPKPKPKAKEKEEPKAAKKPAAATTKAKKEKEEKEEKPAKKSATKTAAAKKAAPKKKK